MIITPLSKVIRQKVHEMERYSYRDRQTETQRHTDRQTDRHIKAGRHTESHTSVKRRNCRAKTLRRKEKRIERKADRIIFEKEGNKHIHKYYKRSTEKQKNQIE